MSKNILPSTSSKKARGGLRSRTTKGKSFPSGLSTGQKIGLAALTMIDGLDVGRNVLGPVVVESRDFLTALLDILRMF